MSRTRQYRLVVLALTTAAFFGLMVARVVISPLVPEIIDYFAVSNALIGFVLTGMWGAYAAANYPGGALADHYGERTLILLGLVVALIGSLSLVFVTSFWVFALCVLFMGFGAGLYPSVGISLLTKIFDDPGQPLGVHAIGPSAAGLVAPPMAVYLAAEFGWQPAVALGSAFILPVFVLIYLYVEPQRERSNTAIREQLSIETARELLSRPPVAYTIVLATIGMFGYTATFSFLPTFLVSSADLSVETAGLLFSGYFIALGISQPLAGWLGDRFGNDISMLVTATSGVVGYTLLVLGPHIVGVLLPVGLIAASMSFVTPVQARITEHLDDTERGKGVGLIRTGFMVVGATGNAAVGVLADFVGWSVAFGFLTVFPLTTVVLLLVNHSRGGN